MKCLVKKKGIKWMFEMCWSTLLERWSISLILHVGNFWVYFVRMINAVSHFYRTMPLQNVCAFVRPSVRHSLVLCWNGWMYSQTFFHLSNFSAPNVMDILRQEPPNGGIECSGIWKKWRMKTNNISLYVGNHNHKTYL